MGYRRSKRCAEGRGPLPIRASLAPVLFGFLILIAVPACSDDSTQDNVSGNSAPHQPPSCRPEGVGPRAGDGGAARKPTARIYLDRSQSMAGYVAGGIGPSQALADLITLLRHRLRSEAESYQVNAFGAQISAPLDDAALNAFSRRQAYICAGCDNRESRIDAVLDQISRGRPDQLDIVVTDLWLDNASFDGSMEVALGEPLRSILQSGRAVGILGIRAGFEGPIYDVPSVGTYRHSGERALFVVMAGPARQLARIYRGLIEAGSPALAPERVSFSLFGTELPDPWLAGGAVFAARGGGARQATVMRARQLEDPQFHLSASRAAAQQGRIEGRFTRDAGLPGLIWEGGNYGRARVWRFTGSVDALECAPDMWQELPQLPNPWRAEPSAPGVTPSHYRFTVDHQVNRRLPEGVYYVLAELGTEPPASDNPQSRWMASEWSLAPERAPQVVARRPRFFPALKLDRVRAILEAELQRQVTGARVTERSGFVLKLER